jgi:formate C-acetyltransferase
MEAIREKGFEKKSPLTNMGFMYEKPYLSDRVKGLRDTYRSAEWGIDVDRMKYFTEAYKETEGEFPAMRNARGLEKALANMTIRIDDEELLAGAKSSRRYSAPGSIEVTGLHAYETLALALYRKGKTVPEVLPRGFGRRSAEFLKHITEFTEEEYRLITEEILPYWGIEISDSLLSRTGPSAITRSPGNMPAIPWSHVSLGIEKLLKTGLRGIAREAADRISLLDSQESDYGKKKNFLEAIQVSTDAVCRFAERYASLAEEKAETAAPGRKKELLEIAGRCRRVPAETPRTFMEALQSIYLVQMAVIVSHGDTVICPGRVDQVLDPFYKEDMKAGRITPEQALEAIEEYQIKTAYSFNGPGVFTIGGLGKDGEDATNDVSHLFIEAHRNLKGLCNGIAARISEKTPRNFLMKVCEVNRHTAGVAIYNDEVHIRDLVQDGYAMEDARNWCNIGCTEITGSANNNGNTAVPLFHLPLLEMALNEGRSMASGWKQTGASTPPASGFKSFEDVKKAFADQVARAIERTVREVEKREPRVQKVCAQPLLSATIEGCIESGTDLYAGGARYNSASIGNQGLATQADSLAAIKWAVFDKKLFTLEELVHHMRNNFKGAEDVRRQLLNAPKYGNDDPYVDEIAEWVVQNFAGELKKHKYWLGGPYRGLMISSGTQNMEGMLVGATPDGRLAGAAVSNGMSPTNAMEKNGLTAALLSAAKASTVPLSDGSALNVNFNPLMIQKDEQLDKFAAVIEGYLAMGGRQVQFNPISRETLLDAQQHPENYPELQVKVSGYSARFIDIQKNLQDDIIRRTSFESC